MSYVPDLHHRRSIRLQAFDYTRDGAYFVTVCSRDRECLFGQVIDGAVNLNEFGQVIGLALTSLPTHFPHVDVPDYVIMPNHLHAIIKIARDDVGAKQGVSASPVSVDIGNSGKADEAFALPLRAAGDVDIGNSGKADEAVALPLRAAGDVDISNLGKADETFALPLRAAGDVDISNLGKADEAFALPLRAAGDVDIGNSGKADEAFALPLRGTVPGSLAAVVQNFKSVTTRKVNALRGTPGIPVWQRNYYERVIRNEAELAAIREYIASNPGSWDQDRNHPENITSAQGQSR